MSTNSGLLGGLGAACYRHRWLTVLAWVAGVACLVTLWMRFGAAAQNTFTSSVPARRDWLKENGWSITAVKDDEDPDGFSLGVDPEWMTGKSDFDQIKSLGGPDESEFLKGVTEAALAEVAELERQHGFRINPDGSRTPLPTKGTP